ncbi:MAG: replication-associated recombination protein A [Chitinophagaceae bacterium]|nr:replication-associated recombination protein A [Chitinophagaceae bacterium]
MKPLAERMRPEKLEEVAGQEHLTARGSILFQAIAGGNILSMILWGPPGSGKTTLAHIIAQTLHSPFHVLSAISSGVKEVREVLSLAAHQDRPILFIDEIHRFNKSQQDALLGAVEKGTVTLIGATTENPSFEVNNALLSRCQVFVLKPLDAEQLTSILRKAIAEDTVLSKKQIDLKETEALINLSGGDARKLLNLLELAFTFAQPENEGVITITDKLVMQAAQQKTALYDKKGEQHYDIISAFIKSMRGSDPNAAVYWLARMIEGGEDIKFIARRMVIFASEDIGNANPTALVLATNCFQAVNVIGNPEARIILSQCAVYLASSIKSNASYMAISEAQSLVKKYGDLPVPMAVRNAPTSLMKNLGYGEGYKYAHSYENNFSDMEFLPDKIKGTKIFDPGKNPREEEIRRFLKARWKEKYGY